MKTDVLNDLIRQARRQQSEIESIRAELVESVETDIVDKICSDKPLT